LVSAGGQRKVFTKPPSPTYVYLTSAARNKHQKRARVLAEAAAGKLVAGNPPSEVHVLHLLAEVPGNLRQHASATWCVTTGKSDPEWATLMAALGDYKTRALTIGEFCAQLGATYG
jgi:hypothetical protein